MKKLVALALVLVLSISLVVSIAETTKVVIGGTTTPHVVILNHIKEDIKALGFELEVLDFAEGWVNINPTTSAGELDANYFQHLPYLNAYNKEVKLEEQLVAVIPVHYEPYGIYAGTKKNLDDIGEGDKIAITNDPANETRALLLLQDKGWIKLADDVGPDSSVTILDIVENPYKLEIQELNAELIPTVLADVAFAVINGNYVLAAGLSVAKDALFLEPAEGEAGKTYTNYIVVKAGNENAPFIEALKTVLYTQEIKDWILDNPEFQGGVIPTFEVPAK